MEFSKSAIIVTGATSGMGKAIAQKLALSGASLILNGRHLDRGRELERDCRKIGISAHFVPGDISLPETSATLVSECMQHFGGVSGVSHNAGVLGLGKITELDFETWQHTMATNLSSAFYLLKESLPHLTKLKGAVVINASIAAQKSFPGHPAYCSSKAGLLALTKQAALDYPEVRINAICPGPVDTPLLRNSVEAFPNSESIIEETRNATLRGRLGKPEDVANLVRFLLSDEADWITGAAYTIDGGITVK
jgi:NAD(P)-dependent dehydrogenase (short-subunit alcohol dehydrogenase family)